ncbi:hypothetical protein TBLA_0B04410 [Henningerozyma blattae CBS 6284]|uniref:3-methyl-2-oxobutanoate hydroxymethyltransferase n=1 Tax=Henningerozyma blattae (strain ATCC 34711 / CBS 6284 / DSM 70876 / NBRC 10599 / NRRL Y-10934 / UCD 77-7) TaxID=1071380 RepID=I2GYS6_HENB6|nr:hypothetical protein TBLA_0B04410 [Tetrapisispora blattae CBS 6284]CCH59278.1 hypothetical protein TBLA_0B04410 [Tetrapisispora blattae CBS 6284]
MSLRFAVRRLYSTYNTGLPPALTIPDLLRKYQQHVPITMITAHDYITAKWAQDANIDIILIGDSLNMTALGQSSTTSLTMSQMQHHLKSVTNSEGSSLFICDMPQGSYEVSMRDALDNAYKLIKSSPKVASLKLECGPVEKDVHSHKVVEALCSRGIPIMGHIGLTPQRAHAMGGFKVQSNTEKDAYQLLDTAKNLEKVGCWSLLLECVPERIGEWLSNQVSIPIIGIGAGRAVDGQVLVVSDALGMLPGDPPKFVQRYAQVGDLATRALKEYAEDVRTRSFPQDQNVFKIKKDVWNALKNNDTHNSN